jgi:hypothetical protein
MGSALKETLERLNYSPWMELLRGRLQVGELEVDTKEDAAAGAKPHGTDVETRGDGRRG